MHADVVDRLPPWPPDQRAMPNVYARSAIFSVRNRRTPRQTLLNAPIFVLGSSDVTYTGIELRAEDDELVWLEVLHMAKQWSLNAWIEFTMYAFCRALGWPTSKTYYERAHNSLLRLKATAVSVSHQNRRRGRALSMLDAYEWSDAEGRTLRRRRVKLNRDIGELFANDRFVRVRWAVYRALTPVARRLYDFAASHREPYPVKLASLRAMCGSDCESRPRRWRQTVLRALAELARTELLSAEVRGELVHIERRGHSSVEVRREAANVVSWRAPMSSVGVRTLVTSSAVYNPVSLGSQ